MNDIERRKSLDDVAEMFMYVESNVCLCVKASASRRSRSHRPLGIPILKDTIVQDALVIIRCHTPKSRRCL